MCVVQADPIIQCLIATLNFLNDLCYVSGFDRELSVAGCVIVKTATGGFERRLIHCKRPVMRVPNLCIHLQSAAERASFTINKETHLTRTSPH